MTRKVFLIAVPFAIAEQTALKDLLAFAISLAYFAAILMLQVCARPVLYVPG